MFLDLPQNLLQFVTPAIILSMAVFFVRLFGKVISEQKPFTNDRGWEIEFSGLWFFVNYILLPGVISMAILNVFGQAIIDWLNDYFVNFSPITFHWVSFTLVFLIGAYYAFTAYFLMEEKQNTKTLTPKTTQAGIDVFKEKRTFSKIASINAAILQPSILIVILIFGIEIFSKDLLWISIFLIQVFIAFIAIALNYAIMKYNFPKINIYFTTTEKPLQNVMLVKVNEENIIIRDIGKTLIINKEHIFKWEVIDTEQALYKRYSVIPFIVWLPTLLALYLFWENKFVMAIVFGIILPMLMWVIGVVLSIILGGNEKNAISNLSGKNTNNIPTVTKAALFVLSASFFIGSFSAWYHNLWITIIMGIIVQFIAWVVFVYSSQSNN